VIFKINHQSNKSLDYHSDYLTSAAIHVTFTILQPYKFARRVDLF